jgi:molecular chaperone DnaK (HSP70)
MQVAVLGIDLGKNSCSVVGLDGSGKVVVRRRMQRETVIAFSAKLPTCVSSQWRRVAGRITWAEYSPRKVTRCALCRPSMSGRMLRHRRTTTETPRR